MTLPDRQTADLGVPGVVIDATGLLVPDGLAYGEWERIGFHLGVLRDMTSWALGDWLLAGESLYGERAAQGVEITGRSKATLMEYARVARLVPRERRREMSFTHHQLVAARPPEEQKQWLDKTEETGWSCEELRGALQADPAALSTRRNRSRAAVEVLELVETVARDLLDAVEPLEPGYVRLPEYVVDRLANALGTKRGAV